MLKQITHRPLWFNILTAVAVGIIFIVLLVLSLQWCTHHGRARTVPMVVGKTFSAAQHTLDSLGFDVIVQDSVFVDTLPPSTVIKQIPESDAVVKVNRTVYLTVNRSESPMVDMPNLIGFSYRNAILNLTSLGLTADTTYKADFATNTVLEQLYNGQPIAGGTKIRMGSKVLLVLANGLGSTSYFVPQLTGMTYMQAKGIVEAKGVNIQIIDAGGVTDTLNAFVVSQDPKRMDDSGQPSRIRAGQMIFVKLGSQKPAVDSLNQLPQ